MITNATLVAFFLGEAFAFAFVIATSEIKRHRARRRRATAKRDAHTRRQQDRASEHTHAVNGRPQTCWDKDCPKPTVEVHLS